MRGAALTILTHTAVLMAACLMATADDFATFEASLHDRFVGKAVTMKEFYSNNELKFDLSGNFVGAPKAGFWTLDANVLIDAAEVKHNELRLSGRRVVVRFKGGQQELAATDQKRSLEIPLANPFNQQQIEDALARIFLSGREQLVDFVPDYWKPFLSQQSVNGRVPLTTDLANITRVGGVVEAPRPISTPDPRYTDLARRSHFEGTSTLWIVVGADGLVHDVKITKPLGVGLDDEAVEAVKRWRFHPATKDGQPVAVQINVEVNFRLYR